MMRKFLFIFMACAMLLTACGTNADAPISREDVLNDTAEEQMESERKLIALTFDDGPTAHTGRLLDILKTYDIKASFFVIYSSYIDCN